MASRRTARDSSQHALMTRVVATGSIDCAGADGVGVGGSTAFDDLLWYLLLCLKHRLDFWRGSRPRYLHCGVDAPRDGALEQCVSTIDTCMDKVVVLCWVDHRRGCMPSKALPTVFQLSQIFLLFQLLLGHVRVDL